VTVIHGYMHDDHRSCDELFVAVESAVVDQDWDRARSTWRRFSGALLRHFVMEEDVLFPKLEEATGMSGGPTDVMRMDHAQLRAMLPTLEAALLDGNADDFLGNSQAMMVLMQQHNMKEEQVLYPMADQALTDGAAIVHAMEDCGGRVDGAEPKV